MSSLEDFPGANCFPPDCSLLICLLGNFLLLTANQPILLAYGSKAEILLSHLALYRGNRVPRDALLNILWPRSPVAQAGQSLNSLIYSLHKLLRPHLAGAYAIEWTDGYYQLNRDAGIEVDLVLFDNYLDDGETHARTGKPDSAAASFRTAISLYRGDLNVENDVYGLMERERLRARYLTPLAWLANYHYDRKDYTTCMKHALRLLESEPCREDAHRLVMLCHVQRGERAQALRQYRLCESMLRNEFEAEPEPETRILFDRIRLNPESIHTLKVAPLRESLSARERNIRRNSSDL